MGLLTDEGDNLPLKLQGSAAGSRVLASEDSETAQLLLTTKKATFTLQNVPQQPVVSVLRGFSAPVRALVDPQSLDDIALIAKSDRDVFARFNAINRLLTRRTLYELYWAAADDGGKETPSEIKRDVQRAVDAAGGVDGVPEALIAAYKAVLAEDQPGGTKGYMLSVPGIQDMENSVESPEPLLLWQVSCNLHSCRHGLHFTITHGNVCLCRIASAVVPYLHTARQIVARSARRTAQVFQLTTTFWCAFNT